MRFILMIWLAFCFTSFSAQNDTITSCDDAVEYALKHNATAVTFDQKKDLVRDIESSWCEMLFHINKISLLQEYLGVINDLERIATLRYKEGDIDILQMNTYINLIAQIKGEILITANEIDIATNRIRKLLLSDVQVVPSDSLLRIYEIKKYSLIQNDTSFLSIKDYSDDSLSNVNAEFLKSKDIENLKLSLDNCFIRLQYYEQNILVQAGQIVKINGVRLRTEEIDYLRYTDSIEKAFADQLAYLEILKNYNLTAIQLEYYAF